MHVFRVIYALMQLFFYLVMAAVAQDEVIMLAPGESVPMVLQLGSEKSSLEIQAPTFGKWSLSPDQYFNEIYGTMAVKSSGQGNKWSVTIPAGIENCGILAEYDIAAGTYVKGGEKLDSSLQIVAEGGNSVDLTTGGILISSRGSDDIAITLKQIVSYNNPPLQDGHIYRTSVTFVIGKELS